jgi:prevent-host-death family protein
VTLGSNVLWGDLSGVMDRVRGGEEIIVTRRGKPQFKMTPLT